MDIKTVIHGSEVWRVAKSKEAFRSLCREAEFTRFFFSISNLLIPRHLLMPDLPGIEYPYIPGELFGRSFYEQLSDDQKEQVAQQLSTFVKLVHETPLSLADSWGLEGMEDSSPYVEAFLQSEAAPRWIALCEKYFKLWKKLPQETVVIHGDLSEFNILTDETKITAVIDFAKVCKGAIWRDFSYLYRVSPKLVERMLELYGRPDLLEPVRLDCIIGLFEKINRNIPKGRQDRIERYFTLLEEFV
ncbi:MAG: aminoglycoside phosphotransferase family protein [Chlamydiia bacterium]|nr:aminoglycoside phosphotransferase family protein [Chlamydiia bacterium]